MNAEQLIVALVVVAAVGFGVARTVRIIPQAIRRQVDCRQNAALHRAVR